MNGVGGGFFFCGCVEMLFWLGSRCGTYDGERGFETQVGWCLVVLEDGAERGNGKRRDVANLIEDGFCTCGSRLFEGDAELREDAAPVVDGGTVNAGGSGGGGDRCTFGEGSENFGLFRGEGVILHKSIPDLYYVYFYY